MADIEVIKVEAGINVDVSREFNQVDLTNAVGRAETAAASAEADLVLTNADVVTTGINATNSQLSAWESEAERLTAASYATEAEDVPVNLVTSDGDGTFTYTPQAGVFSALHWEAKSVLATADFVLKSGDTMTGALNVPAGATGTQVAQVQEVVKKSGDTMTGALSVPSGATTTQVPQVQEVIKKSGDTMTGNLEVPSITIGGDYLSVYSLRKFLINGNFPIWQRATSQTTSGYGSDDRWSNGNEGSTKTHSQQIATDTERVLFASNYFSRTVVSSVAGAANYVDKEQRIENVTKLAGKTVTISFWAKADASKNIAIDLEQYFGTGGTPSSPVQAIGAQLVGLTSTWSKYEVTIAVPTIVGKTLGTDGVNTSYTRFIFWFDAGSSFDVRAASLGNQSGTFDIAEVQLEEGSVATPFEQRPIGLELTLCQRYYEMVPNLHYYVGYEGTTSAVTQWIEFKVVKRVVPTISYANYVFSGFTSGALSSITVRVEGLRAQDTGGSGYTASDACVMGFTWSADAEI